MDPRVLAHYAGDVNLANIHPPKREEILARYGNPNQRRMRSSAA